MAVPILDDLPDVAVNRGDPLEPMRTSMPRRPARSSMSRVSGRAGFAAGVVGLHLVALVAFMNAEQIEHALLEPEPMVVSLMDAPSPSAEPPRDLAPPPQDVAFMLAPPPDVTYETETMTPPSISTTSIEQPGAASPTPPVVESVEYVRAPAPAYPAESSRRRERGTVLLRVLVDVQGRPAQIQVERSSGYSRLDEAARAAVEKALFQPYEVNGVAQPAQVLIPIEFTRRS